MMCRIRKVYWHLLSGWQGDCTCGFTSGEKRKFSDVMDTLEKHWQRSFNSEQEA